MEHLSKDMAAGISDKVVSKLKNGSETASCSSQPKAKRNKLQGKRSLASPASGSATTAPDIHPELTWEQVTSGVRTGRPPVRQTSIEGSKALEINTMFDYAPGPRGSDSYSNSSRDFIRLSRPRFREGRR